MRCADGRALSLRAIEPADRERLRRWRNDPRVRSHMANPAPIAGAEHDAWFARIADSADALVTIFEIDGEPSGVIQLSGLTAGHGHARWGFYLRPDGAPPGSGRRMGFLMLRHGFEDLGLHRVHADVLGSNERSLRMHERLGFALEGRWRDHLRRDGAWADLVLFGMLETEFRTRCPALEAELFG